MNSENRDSPETLNAETERGSRLSGLYVGQVRGIRLYLHFSWFFIVAILLYSLAKLTFPVILPGRTPALYWGMSIASTLLFFGSILLHELGHSLVSQRCGIPVPRITLLFIGGIAEISREPESPNTELKIAIGGPLVTCLLIFLFFAGAILAHAAQFPATALVLGWLGQVNLVLLIFNAIPAYPLDGGRIFRALLWKKNGSLRKATHFSSRIGRFFGMFLAGLGFYILIRYGAWNGIVFILIGFFISSAAESGYSQTVVKEILEGVDVRRIMNDHPIAIPGNLPLNLAVEEYFLQKHHSEFPVVDDENYFLGMLDLEKIKAIPREKWPYLQARELCTRKELHSKEISPYSKASRALTAMSEPGKNHLGVTDNEGHLIGIVSLNDLLQFIRIRTELEA